MPLDNTPDDPLPESDPINLLLRPVVTAFESLFTYVTMGRPQSRCMVDGVDLGAYETLCLHGVRGDGEPHRLIAFDPQSAVQAFSNALSAYYLGHVCDSPLSLYWRRKPELGDHGQIIICGETRTIWTVTARLLITPWRRA